MDLTYEIFNIPSTGLVLEPSRDALWEVPAIGGNKAETENSRMVTILAAGILLWMVVGGIVAIVVCPLLKQPEEHRETPRKAA
jgi:hypothetical protein